MFAETGVVVTFNQDLISMNQADAGGARVPGFGATAGVAGHSIGGGVFVTGSGSKATKTTITNNKATTDPNVHGKLS